MIIRDRPGVGAVDDLGLPPITGTTTSSELRSRRGHVLAHAGAIITQFEERYARGESSELSAKEKALFDRRVAEVELLDDLISRREALEAAEARAILARTEATNTGAPKTMNDTTISAVPFAGGRLTAFANSREGHEQAFRAGQWLRAAFTAAPDARRWIEEHGVGVQAALSGGINTTGGALIPEELARVIIDLREQYGVARRLCRVVPMGSDSLAIPRRTGGVTAYFVGENAEGTESDASWDNVLLSAKKLMTLTRMSSEIAEDAVINLADYLAREIAYSFAVREDECLINGTGSSSYGGIVGVLAKALDGSHNMAKVTAATDHDRLAEVDVDDLTSMIAAVPEYAKPGSAWLCSSEAEAVIFQSLLASTGGATPSGLAGPLARSFLGYPIVVSPSMPSSLTTDYTSAAMLGFGNLSLAATLGSRREIRVALSDQRYWSSDQIGVKGSERFDLVVHDLGSNTAKSPFVVLVGG